MTDEEVIQNLKSQCSQRGRQTETADALGVGKSTVGRWIDGKEITPSHMKLLRLYLYGEMPFDMISPHRAPDNHLRFTPTEWQIITILSKRDGFITPNAWITAKIRGYLENNETALQAADQIKNTTPSSLVAEEPPAYQKSPAARKAQEIKNAAPDQAAPSEEDLGA